MMPFRDVRAQYEALRAPLDKAVAAVMGEGRYIGGPRVRDLEERLADYVGARHCVTCANGTDALSLALMAWGIGPGDAVLVPDFTFFATAEAVARVGAVPVFVDVDPLTCNISPASLEKAASAAEAQVDARLAAVVAVDLFGLPADYPALRAVCERRGLLLLEDGAQGFGGAVGSRQVGSLGDISATSFFPSKPLSCMGDGGAVFTDNDDWAALIRSLAAHGAGASKYENARIGMNSRLDALQAAVLLVKMDAFERELDAAREAAGRYGRALGEVGLGLPVVPDGFESAWAQYTVRLPERVDREAFRSCLADLGVPTQVYYPQPLHSQAAWDEKVVCFGSPETERLCRTVVSLPMGPYLSDADQRCVIDAVGNALQAIEGASPRRRSCARVEDGGLL